MNLMKEYPVKEAEDVNRECNDEGELDIESGKLLTEVSKVENSKIKGTSEISLVRKQETESSNTAKGNVVRKSLEMQVAQEN